MKKYKHFIEITKENLWEVLNIPIVDQIDKVRGMFEIEGQGRAYVETVGTTIWINGYDNPLSIGDFLALDICDNWHAFSKNLWPKHKDDEIETNSK